ncbi:AMP-dependent synthetase [Nocardioides psychrotolerans]|uniref:Long-chain acyl-CoA synthetase n=1 Tax=Nocardioides psychrotolerans TaxID=1005945 RepID=A0A1I3H4Y6_9ACTN|nr:long-chain fatty acid--CoA ligase [Nocardioides psychrotolerans]GEP37747.1 AMP-dependent synthetase [Nocardioides psychrotolerans]SFI30764.1 long-chain acyl-CoA synthetase [Nocardioides psychrotolerans]
MMDTTTALVRAPSVARMFYDRAESTPDAEAYRFPTAEAWSSVTWTQAKGSVTTLAAGLIALGLEHEDRVAIASSTRIEWVYADLAVACAGGATTTVYPSTGAADVAFILADSGSRIVFAEDDTQIAKLREQRAQLPGVERVVTFDGTPDGEWVISLEDLQALGSRHLADCPSAVDDVVAAILPEHLATLIYTSGTTGRPKGVQLPQSCWTYIGAGAESLDILSHDDLQYLWLPLSHSFGKMLEVVQLQIGFPTAVDGRMDKIVENLAVVRPTFMAGPPRIFEKVHAKVVQTVEEEGGLRSALFSWAFGVGDRVAQARLRGQQPALATRLQHTLADRLVLSKVRARLGGRIRFLISGSAAISPDVAAWFYASGMLVLEGYGLTETSAGACIVRLDDPVFGWVGSPIVGTEIRTAEDGEVFVRGPSVMRGYHNQPEATAEVLDADGWLATGDVGEIDDQGRLRITDRKKDLVKTSGGKYIAPQPIEGLFKALCPLGSQMVVHAEGRNYATALVTLDPDALAQWVAAHESTGADYASQTADPAVRAYVQECLDNVNSRLNRWETIKGFRILDHDLSVESGELTPSMKVRRKFVESTYKPLLDSMYADADRERH